MHDWLVSLLKEGCGGCHIKIGPLATVVSSDLYMTKLCMKGQRQKAKQY